MKTTKEEKSWIMYDFANSAFATIMIAAIFPIYFTQVAQSAGQAGDYWWGIGTAVATAVIALFWSLIGTIADFKGYKKKVFTFFLAIGLIFLC